MATNLKDLYKLYVRWITRNPQLTSEIETNMRLVSYLFVGQFVNSQLVAELIFSASNLLTFMNDSIIARLFNNPGYSSVGVKLKEWITVIEYTEVFLELTALNAYGVTGKWILIACVQIFKSIARLCLLILHKQYLLPHPPILPMDRKKYTKSDIHRGSTNEMDINSESFNLPSGRTIRSIRSGVCNINRSWIPPCSFVEDKMENYITRRKLAAEIMYIVKPLIHLSSLYHCGETSWCPWLISLIIDFASLKLMLEDLSEKLDVNKEEELRRRLKQVFHYVLRSPFYDKKTKRIMFTFLNILSSKLPVLRYVIDSVRDYIPKWQSIYFYLWSR